MINRIAPLINVGLRMATLGTRFVLVFILAKFLDAASLGYYGLFTAAVGYAILCVGLDLYVYTTREITKVDTAMRGALLKSQVSLVTLLYIVLVPIAVFLLPSAGLPDVLIWWFFPILILEHLNQELYRLLIILSEQLSASFLLFLRQGSWALAAAGLMAIDDNSRNLNIVLLLWAGAGVIAAMAGMWKIHRLRFGGWKEKIDWRWLRRGIAVSGGFLVATLAVRGVQTIDRYWLESLAGIEIVGAYVLFFGLASALNVFLDAGIFSFRYPELVVLNNHKEYGVMRRKVNKMWQQAIGSSVAFVAISSFLLPFLLGWIDKSIYLSSIGLYYWILAAMIFYSLSMIPHYALYALGHDRPIIVSHMAALIVFFLATSAAIHISATVAVPVGVLVAMITVFIWKVAAYLRAFGEKVDDDDPSLYRSTLSK